MEKLNRLKLNPYRFHIVRSSIELGRARMDDGDIESVRRVIDITAALAFY